MIYIFTILPLLLGVSFLLNPKSLILKIVLNVFRISGGIAFSLLILRLYFLDIYKIPSESMERTLLVGDKIIIHKDELPEHNELVVFEEIKDTLPTVMVKRTVGLPGDTISIIGENVFCNGQQLPEAATIQRSYYYNDSMYSTYEFEELISRHIHISKDKKKKVLLLSQSEADSLNKTFIESNIRRTTRGMGAANNLYPFKKQLGNNRDNFHPFWVPKKGVTITFTKHNLWWYRPLIAYENTQIEFKKDGTILIDHKEINTYTFKNNYYYFLGDNRHRSRDSRFWGFIPEKNIYGKVLFAITPEYKIKRIIL